MDKYYILILGWVAVMGILSIMISMKRVEMVCGKEEYRWKPVWAVVTVVPLIWMCSQRGGIMDTGVYLEGFKDMPGVFSGIASYMGTVKKDKGFYFLSAVIKCIVGNNSVVYLFIIAVLQAGMLFYVYRKYSSRYLVSFFLFLASTDYISWMFNGMRQFLAVTITFIGIKFILDKKYVKAIILILIASLMHQSALLMIPFIFIVNNDQTLHHKMRINIQPVSAQRGYHISKFSCYYRCIHLIPQLILNAIEQTVNRSRAAVDNAALHGLYR